MHGYAPFDLDLVDKKFNVTDGNVMDVGIIRMKRIPKEDLLKCERSDLTSRFRRSQVGQDRVFSCQWSRQHPQQRHRAASEMGELNHRFTR